MKTYGIYEIPVAIIKKFFGTNHYRERYQIPASIELFQVSLWQ